MIIYLFIGVLIGAITLLKLQKPINYLGDQTLEIYTFIASVIFWPAAIAIAVWYHIQKN